MKVDNFDLIKKHIHSSDSNEFYMLQIMRRTKDQKGYDGKHKQSIIKSYFISSVEYLDSKRDEIVGLCEMFNARAYINLNKKSYKQVSLKALEILAGKIAHEEYDIRSLFESACGQTGACDGQKTWIVDFDSKDLDELDRLTDAIAEYEAAYYPLPGRVSTLLVCAIKDKMKEKGINQKRAAELLGISEKRISDLLCGKGKLDLNIVKRLRDNLGLSADFILDMV